MGITVSMDGNELNVGVRTQRPGGGGVRFSVGVEIPKDKVLPIGGGALAFTLAQLGWDYWKLKRQADAAPVVTPAYIVPGCMYYMG